MIATLMRGVVRASGYADALFELEPPLELQTIPFVLALHRRNDLHPAQRWFWEVISDLNARMADDAPA